MSTIPRSVLICGVGLALSSCFPFESAPPAVDDDSATIAAWIDDHRGALPTDYDEVGRLPWPYRRAVVGELPHTTQSALVQTHLARYVLAHPELTPAQSEGSAVAQELMTPAWYALAPLERQRVGEEELNPDRCLRRLRAERGDQRVEAAPASAEATTPKAICVAVRCTTALLPAATAAPFAAAAVAVAPTTEPAPPPESPGPSASTSRFHT
jgi:hypothetical protein